VPVRLQGGIESLPRVFVIFSTQKKFADTLLLHRIRPNAGRERNQFTLRLGSVANPQEELDEFQPRIPAPTFLVARPYRINCVVVVTVRVVRRSSMYSDSRQFEIDDSVLRFALPQVCQVSQSLPGVALTNQGLSQL